MTHRGRGKHGQGAPERDPQSTDQDRGTSGTGGKSAEYSQKQQARSGDRKDQMRPGKNPGDQERKGSPNGKGAGATAHTILNQDRTIWNDICNRYIAGLQRYDINYRQCTGRRHRPKFYCNRGPR